MPLSEAEELELLELEEQEAKAKAPPPPAPAKPGILSAIDQSLTEHENKVGEQLAAPEKYPLQHAVQTASGVLGEVPAATAPVINAAINPQVIDEKQAQKFRNFISKITTPIASVLNKVQQKAPAVSDVAGLGLNALGVLPMASGAGKALEGIPESLNNVRGDIGGKLMNAANRMENTSIKIGAAGEKGGAKIENYGKYGLFGKPAEVVENAKAQIQNIASQLKEKIAAANNPANETNILDVLSKTSEKALAGTRTDKIATQNAFNKITDELLTTYGEGSGNIDLAEAQLLKREIGKKGDWYSSPMGGMIADPEASIKSKIYNQIYDVLKKHIEQAGGPEIKQLNDQLSELIPLEREAQKRAMVVNRNNPIRLDDYIGALATAGSAAHGNFLPAAVAGVNILSKSPGVAKSMYNFGKFIKGKPIIPRTPEILTQ
jgi:hypothetical protein